MLFNDQSLWFYRNGLRKPVTLSRRQRLTGQAANGDIAATDYAGNYTATVQGEEKVDGEDSYKMLLKSKNANNTYDQIRYWVSKSRKLALKAEFLTLQGEPFKRATFKYDNTVATATGTIPFVSEMRIEDGEFKNNYSVIRYKSPSEKSLGHSIFNVGNLTN
jgi:outer membrane lipoprotein-sorting protein